MNIEKYIQTIKDQCRKTKSKPSNGLTSSEVYERKHNNKTFSYVIYEHEDNTATIFKLGPDYRVVLIKEGNF